MRRRLLRALFGPAWFDDARAFVADARVHPRLALAFARASATSALRELDATNPVSWEFSGFSQNGEDGIIDYLCHRLLSRNRYFVEIGCGSGLENNTSWLALGKRYGGLMIDADPEKAARCAQVLRRLNWALDVAAIAVSRRTIPDVERRLLILDPDVFSLDIDGIDYHVAAALLERGFRPKIVVVEYNSAYGPDRSVTVPEQEIFDRRREHPTGLYYGASITAWRRLLNSFGYRFITVEQNGVNAFFVDPAAFRPEFLDAVQGETFRENVVQRLESKQDWRRQFQTIHHLPLVEIPAQRPFALDAAASA